MVMARTFCDASDDVDSHLPVEEHLAVAVEVVLQGALWDERVHEEALGSAFGAAEPEEVDEIFVLHLHEGLDCDLKVLLSDCVSCVVDRLHSHDGAVA